MTTKYDINFGRMGVTVMKADITQEEIDLFETEERSSCPMVIGMNTRQIENDKILITGITLLVDDDFFFEEVIKTPGDIAFAAIMNHSPVISIHYLQSLGYSAKEAYNKVRKEDGNG